MKRPLTRLHISTLILTLFIHLVYIYPAAGNIKVGDYSIVNPGAVVTKPVAPYTRVGGVPAKFLSKLT